MSGAHLAAQAVAYLSLIILARLISPGSFGTVAAATAIVWIAVLVMGAGTHGSIVVRPRLTHAELRQSFRRCLLAATALAVAMAIGAQVLVATVAKGGDAAAVATLGLFIPMYAIAVIPMAVLHRVMEFRKLARTMAIANVGSAVVAVAAGLAGAGVWALVARQLLWSGLLAALASRSARAYLPGGRSEDEPVAEQAAPSTDGRWFLLFGVTLLVALSVDYLVIGSVDGVTDVGLYAIAFMIAFAPMQHFSGEVGKVLFAAAASDRPSTGGRTTRSVQLMSALLLPLLPIAIVLAPVVFPAILGSEWTGMVGPFQILLAVGVGHAVINCIGEALSGVGQIRFRAKVNLGWCAATLVALLILVPVDGIRGAALAHVVAFLPLASVYAFGGARRAGTAAPELWRALRPVVSVVAAQSAVTAAVALGLSAVGASSGFSAATAALSGLVMVVAISSRGRIGRVRAAVVLLRATGRPG